MEQAQDETQVTKLESIFIVGIIGCMLFATWELAHLMTDEWFEDWVDADEFIRQRIIYYGIAFFMAGASVLLTTQFAFQFGRFGRTVNRAFLWYGVLLLISTIAIFVFDCLPEVVAGFLGAGVFIAAIYLIQKKFYTKERIIQVRLDKGKCFACGSSLQTSSLFCSNCGVEVGKKCPECQSLLKLNDKFCWNCRHSYSNSRKTDA